MFLLPTRCSSNNENKLESISESTSWFKERNSDVKLAYMSQSIYELEYFLTPNNICFIYLFFLF